MASSSSRDRRTCFTAEQAADLGMYGNKHAKLKISNWEDCVTFRHARWIMNVDGTWTSVTGSKHWATDVDAENSDDDDDDDEGEEDGQTASTSVGFYQWKNVRFEGGAKFCYAVVDCGTSIQEKPGPHTPIDQRDVHSVLEMMVEAGIQRVVLKGSSIKKAERAKDLVSLYPDIMGFSVGYHPELVGAWKSNKLTTLQQLAEDPACVAVGECGLDFSGGQGDAGRQIELFKLQVEMACQLQKPLLVFERQAQNRVLEILQGYQGRLPPVAIRSQSAECDYSLYIQRGCFLVITGWMFKADYYKSRFFTWLGAAQPWQTDYLLLASNSPHPEEFPLFASKVLESEYQRVIQQVDKNNYSDAARAWASRNVTKSSCTPLYLPVMVEMLAEGLRPPPSHLANKCLENAKRFFQVVRRPEKKKEVKSASKWGWEVAKFLFPMAASLTVMYSGVLRQPLTCFHDWFVNITNTN